MIQQFQGEYRWLSNFAPVPIRIENKTYPSVEHAYMSMKSIDQDWKEFCATEQNPGVIKKASRKIKLRKDWNNSFCLTIMEDFLRIKFKQEPYRSRLFDTGNQNI